MPGGATSAEDVLREFFYTKTAVRVGDGVDVDAVRELALEHVLIATTHAASDGATYVMLWPGLAPTQMPVPRTLLEHALRLAAWPGVAEIEMTKGSEFLNECRKKAAAAQQHGRWQTRAAHGRGRPLRPSGLATASRTFAAPLRPSACKRTPRPS